MRLIDADNVRDLFDAEFKETRKMILAGETHLDNLAEGFVEADRVIRAMPTVDAEVVVRCKDCGEFHAYINRHGMAIPIDDGNMEVHHILPVAQGGGDEAQNLVSLCRNCHQKRHKELKEEQP